MKLLTSDLIYLNDACKSLKCKIAMFLSNKLIGIDDFNYMIFTNLDPDNISVMPEKGLIINQRELSKFIKSISVESYFEIDPYNKNNVIHTMKEELSIYQDRKIESIVIQRLKMTLNIDYQIYNINEVNVSNDLEELYKASKSSGAIHYKYDDTHLMTLFGGIIPLNKSDKLYLKMYDNPDNTFLVRFRVHKKKFDVYVYLLFLKL